MNQKSLIILLFLLLSLSTSASALGTFTILGITLAPTITGTTLSLRITGTNAGYIGLGFGTNMLNADMILITASKGNVSVVDCYSTSNSTPTPDATNDTTLTSGTYTEGVWDVTFTRPLTGTDATDAVISATSSQTVAIAIGATMDTSLQHTNTQVFSMNFGDATQSTSNKSRVNVTGANRNLLNYVLISLVYGVWILM